MKVIVYDPKGIRVQGAHVRAVIKQPPALGLILQLYDKTVTTDQRGEAFVPDPGVLGIDRVADISVMSDIQGSEYTYYGSVKADYIGKFPAVYEIILSREHAVKADNVWLLVLDNAKWIVAGVAVIVVGVTIRGAVKPRTYRA